MGASVGWAWWHHSKLYAKQFNEPVPQWLQEIAIVQRLRLIKLACALAWRLPAQVLSDEATSHQPSARGQ